MILRGFGRSVIRGLGKIRLHQWFYRQSARGLILYNNSTLYDSWIQKSIAIYTIL